MKIRVRSIKGLGTLEAAAISVVLVTFISGATAVTLYMQRSMQVAELVDKYLYDHHSAALSLSPQLEMTVNHPAMALYLDSAANELEVALRQITDRDAVTAEDFRIDVSYREIAIDRMSGTSMGFSGPAVSVSRGALAAPPGIEAETSLAAQMERNSELTVGADGRALYALPTGMFGLSDSSCNYFPGTVLVGIRVLLSIEGGATGRMLSWVGIEPVARVVKVINLRGVV